MKGNLKIPIFSSLAVVVLVLLLCVVWSEITSKPQVARCYKSKQDMRALVAALEIVKKKNDRYPSTSEGLDTLVKEKILDRIPKDPWGNGYFYSSPASLNKFYGFDLYSFGENKLNNNGTGDDYVSWENVNCNRTGNSCLFIAIVYFGLPVFLISLAKMTLKNINKTLTPRKKTRG
jgi:general secretion pathway protein G